MGRRRQTILNQQKREVEAYNLGNRLAEKSCKNIGAKLLSEQVTTEWNVVETYTMYKGIKKWGNRAVESLQKEIGQIHMRDGFEPVDWMKLS